MEEPTKGPIIKMKTLKEAREAGRQALGKRISDEQLIDVALQLLTMSLLYTLCSPKQEYYHVNLENLQKKLKNNS